MDQGVKEPIHYFLPNALKDASTRKLFEQTIGWPWEDTCKALIRNPTKDFDIRDLDLPVQPGGVIVFALPVDDFFSLLFSRPGGGAMDRKAKRQRQLFIEDMATKNLYVACLVVYPRELVARIYRQLPPAQAFMHPSVVRFLLTLFYQVACSCYALAFTTDLT
jgi:hypothetical protein